MGSHEEAESGESLGECSECAAVIPASNLGIRYDRAGSWPILLAKCPACGDVVHPE